MTRLPLLLSLLLICAFARADEPFLKKNDVIALVGGEDMVAASEYGYLELLLTRALPDYHLKFRNLAWEGDTVFEQPRQLNFPTWEQQLDKIGATVVICQFGQMESLAGKEKLPEFIAAYEKLLDRFSGGGKRRLVILKPVLFSRTEYLDWRSGKAAASASSVTDRAKALFAYTAACTEVAARKDAEGTDVAFTAGNDQPPRRDGLHLSETGHGDMATVIAFQLLHVPELRGEKYSGSEPLRQLIIAKNRLWFDYWRPQNWAFLNGDRITQPSSRDHRDPNIRWFPAEMEQFLPLIAAKEEAIWKLAAELK